MPEQYYLFRYLNIKAKSKVLVIYIKIIIVMSSNIYISKYFVHLWLNKGCRPAYYFCM
jgi:hypothetical protein